MTANKKVTLKARTSRERFTAPPARLLPPPASRNGPQVTREQVEAALAWERERQLREEAAVTEETKGAGHDRTAEANGQ
jgi:hypothetical protein